MSTTTTTIKIGPADHGRSMSLADFEHAEAEEGHLYELSRGMITVVDVPKPRHLALVTRTRRQFAAYDLNHPQSIHTLASGGECKILIADLDSERHPDLAIYKTAPPQQDNDVWAVWVPEIVIEVVSPSSRHRDYFEKPEEYLRFGVLEYWVLDAERGELRVFRRTRGRWVEKVVKPPDHYTSRLLPGFKFDCGAVFEAGV